MSRGNPPASEAGRTGPATAVSATASDPPPRATKITVAVLGLLVAFAGIEHGVGEIMQGPVAPESLVIESWRDVTAFAQLGGEPALTVIPNLVITGILAIGVSLSSLCGRSGSRIGDTGAWSSSACRSSCCWSVAGSGRR